MSALNQPKLSRQACLPWEDRPARHAIHRGEALATVGADLSVRLTAVFAGIDPPPEA